MKKWWKWVCREAYSHKMWNESEKNIITDMVFLGNGTWEKQHTVCTQDQIQKHICLIMCWWTAMSSLQKVGFAKLIGCCSICVFSFGCIQLSVLNWNYLIAQILNATIWLSLLGEKYHYYTPTVHFFFSENLTVLTAELPSWLRG